MPKKISIVQKREWLNSYEQGKSEADIAKKAHHDVKTIKSGIEEVRNERDAQLARAELLRDALRKHQDQMLNCIEGVVDALELPPVNLSVDMPVSLRGAKIEFEAAKGLVLTLYSEEKPEWKLLEEHLGKRDRLLKALGNWKQPVTDHIHLRRQLYHELERQLIDKGYTVAVGTGTAPFLYRDTVWLLYRDIVSKSLEKGKRINFEDLIKSRTKTGEVHYGSGTILAEIPGNEERCKDDVLGVLSELLDSPNIINLKETFKKIEEAMAELNKAAVELTLMGLVPGRCRVCRRLGI